MRARWAVGVWLTFVLACVMVISRAQFNTDLSVFLPRSPSANQKVLIEQLRDGVVSRLVLVGIAGGPPAALAQTSTQLAATLRQQSSIASVNNGADSGLSPERELLWRNRYLLSPAVDARHFAAPALREALEDTLQLMGSPAGSLLQRIVPNDPTGELLRLVERMEGADRPPSRNGVWFSRDGARALLVVQTHAPGSDIDAQEAALEQIRDAFSRVPGADRLQLQLTGPGVFSVTSRAAIKHDAVLFSSLAMVLIATLLWGAYRSPRVVALGLLPVASGVLAGVAAVSLGFDVVHALTLGFGATLMGEGVDYALYLFTQQSPGSTPQQTLTRMWPTLRLGVLTSICGFSAMLLSSFTGLAQLGLFSIAGLVVAALVTRYVLPALLPAGFSVETLRAVVPVVSGAARGAPRLRYPLIAIVALCAMLLAFAGKPILGSDLASLSPVPLREQDLDKAMRKDLGAPDVRHVVIVRVADREGALQASERAGTVLQPLIERGALAGFDAADFYLPSRHTQLQRQAALPEQPQLRAAFAQAVQGLPFRAGLFEPFMRDIAAAKRVAPLDTDDLKGTALGLKVNSLLIQREDGWVALLPLRGVSDAAAIGQAIAGLADTATTLLDLKQESDLMYQSYQDEVIRHSLLGAGLIVVLLALSLRAPRRVAAVLAPLAAAVIVTTAALVLGGRQLSIFHLVGLLLVVAVGSNYALFFDRAPSSGEDRERTLVSLLLAVSSTVIGFGLLSFSSAAVLSAIGMTVGLGAILSLVFAAILGRASPRTQPLTDRGAER